MNDFRKVALAATIATYLLILMGGLVRVSGAGLGCPDWPTCFGRWIPPTSVEQLPPDIDTEQFNFRLAWTEYINRLLGMIVGLLIAYTAILALMQYRRTPRILYPSIAAAVLVAIEGWQGSQVVASELKPIIVSAHMVLALIIVCLLTYVAHLAHMLEADASSSYRLPNTSRNLLAGLGVITALQVALGIHLRETLEIIAAGFSGLTEQEWLARVGLPNHIHLFIGILLAVSTWLVMLKILRIKDNCSPMVKKAARVLLVLSLLQLMVGLSFIPWGRVPVLQLMHMWLPTLYIGTLLLLYLAGRSSRRLA
ncbi:MAG: COX15/CtaA family protein [candidate division Zixibacteria bacterium]|nr:COX15/CtaA family protein [candidate division Zixibacteria bacterium]MDH3935995.1 COX15/CtaA family protein [candidate division Zixibacteria bacterium]MDH4032589.1 COX15/CtaA family protein [candidate division Zixibacteria bacterium]